MSVRVHISIDGMNLIQNNLAQDSKPYFKHTHTHSDFEK